MYSDDELYHIGKPHEGQTPHSGRYPYGSGDEPFQRDTSFRAQVAQMRASGLYKNDTEIAQVMGMTTTEFRKKITLEKNQDRAAARATAVELYEKGYNPTEIGRKMGLNESSVRGLLDDNIAERSKVLDSTTQMLKDSMKDHTYIDVGVGVERELGISRTKLDSALKKLEEEGEYEVQNLYVSQVTNPDKKTTIKVLCPVGTKPKELHDNLDKIDSLTEYTSRDGGKSYLGIQYSPTSIDGKRVLIRYAEEGGEARDGTIELRKGVEDISLGNSHYAQVRIAVDGTHYLKGMALYSDDIPDGYDVVFNTNKAKGTPAAKVFKELKKNPDGTIDEFNPFGATIKANGQRWYDDPVTGEKKLSVINKVNEEGDWGEWSKTISAQMLSKQNLPLIKTQLNLSYREKVDEYNDILKIVNPEAKKKMLESFASDCDSTAVHLKAAGFPNQRSQVLIPIPAMKDNEIYAPNYENGEHVVLIRYPHGGTFEIPELVVNNKNPSAKSILGSHPIDAVGINKNVADRLSGADFDGDTVQVIPVNDRVKITTTDPLPELKGFDPKALYKLPDDAPQMKSQTKQKEMGVVSNLITDMTVQGATREELARAVKHSMVVIDAEKHHLDYKQSEIDNNIRELKELYQPPDPITGRGGAATLISRAKSEYRQPKTKDSYGINTSNTDPETGKKITVATGETYTDAKGVTRLRLEKTTRMAVADDARTLSSGTAKEEAYAEYANRLKTLANEARKEYLATGKTEYSPSAKETYSAERDSLMVKLNESLKNAPRERQAQLRASQVVKAMKKDNPTMDSKEEKKKRSQALATARTRVGAGKKEVLITPTDREWEAMMTGAVSSTTITSILNNMSEKELRSRAMPDYSQATTLSSAKVARIKALSNSGRTTKEIADALGISVSTVSKYLS